MRRTTIGLLKGMMISACWIFSLSMFAQNITVRGIVTDAESETLTGVTVQVQGTTTGTVTDARGAFELQGVAPGATLEISYVGMRTEVVQVNGRTYINVTLTDDTELLDELVVVGYGEQRRREITGSVTNVTPAEFNKGVTRDAADLLQGKVAGLEISTPSGDVTAGSRIRLRGCLHIAKRPGSFHRD